MNIDADDGRCELEDMLELAQGAEVNVVLWTTDPRILNEWARYRSQPPGSFTFLCLAGRCAFDYGPATDPQEFALSLRWNAALMCAQCKQQQQAAMRGAEKAGVLLSTGWRGLPAMQRVRAVVLAEIQAAGLQSCEFSAQDVNMASGTSISAAAMAASEEYRLARQDGRGTVHWSVDPAVILAAPAAVPVQPAGVCGAGKSVLLVLRGGELHMFGSVGEDSGAQRLRQVLGMTGAATSHCARCTGALVGTPTAQPIRCHSCGHSMCVPCARHGMAEERSRVHEAAGNGSLGAPVMCHVRCAAFGCGQPLVSAVIMPDPRPPGAPLACTRCSMVVGASIPMLCCTGCRLVSYCCSECQEADWESHKPVCRILARAVARQAAQGWQH